MDNKQLDGAVIVRLLQVIIAAMALGVAMFGGFVVFLWSAAEPESPQLLTLAGAVAGVFLLLGRFVAPFVLANVARTRYMSIAETNETAAGEQLTYGYLPVVIVSRAVAEGGAFLNLVAALADHHVLSLAFAGILLLAVVLPFPTLAGHDAWRDKQLRTIEEMRSLGRLRR